MKYLILNNKKKIKSIIDYLIDKDSLPKIQRRLNIYPEDDTFQIEILDNKINYRKDNRLKAVTIKNKNVKYFFKALDNTKKYYINDISILKFEYCSILFDTYHGSIVAIENEDLCYELEKKFNLKHYDSINDHEHTVTPKLESLFDEVGNLNENIKKYAIKTGLDIRSTSTSLKLRISSISNDYSYLEYYYNYLTNNNLLSTVSYDIKKYAIKNMSIIIPVYNQNVMYSLLSIQGQNLSKEDKQKLQVIIIDDGSKNDVIKDIKKVRDKLDFELQIISFEQNMGLSNARNVGYAISKYDQILFMDSDIILSKNYIYDMNIRLQMIPNAIFICMRKNIEPDSSILEIEKLMAGIDACTDFDDSRVITKGKEYHIGCDKSYIGEEFTILDDTDYFKELSFGSQIGIYNISTVVAGHNMALNKSLIKSQVPFSTKFKGWGMEDAYFSAKLVSDGCYVIPVLSSCVYHINHPPRSGSLEQKNKEALNNYNTYNDLLNQLWE